MLTIWGRINSHNVKKVVWLAEEMGLTYDRRDVGGAFGMDEAYRALNPNALIPTIEDDGFVLWESNSILRYLAANHGGEAFYPTDPKARASAERWMDWGFTWADAIRPIFFQMVRTEADKRDLALIERSVARAAGLSAILDDVLRQQEWLSGEAFGVGDIPVAAYANSWFQLPVERPSRPNLERWYAALQERAPFRDVVMIPLS
ncbi:MULTISPECIES: glutathione S-transferase family protein [Sphingomonas]|jgi:glutathione S-transferase|uniref:Glutathione S-transferase n=1 Tax=Sphingomonas zeae TaxID=1646122 RepID=A0A7Y6B3I6_9SPHN|nr:MULTISPECIES: glutathione S-transferase [Sphingomonas]MBB4048329.1 glutathione S-transferase [Sphingomonas zeae]MDK8186217.1 glutathione S-transferase [Sphingomonas zeae]MDK8215739.1 glutathione S-transferase [Sphingomonas sp. UMB7805-LC452B]NUU46734.1 glutathione S-transferase [Sphingomonas zeae]